MADQSELILSVKRLLPAPRETVWRCWTEIDLLKQWFVPKPWKLAEAELDVRPGGRFNTVMEGPEGERMESPGCLLEVVPEKRLVFTDAFAEGFIPQPRHFMTGFVDLSDTDTGSTQMIWSARHPDEETMKQHLEMGFEQGWNAAVDQLVDLLKRL